MEQKTNIKAEEGKQEIVITREFDLPVELLFKAYAEPDLVAQWMGTKVLRLESRKHGSYQFETTDAQGKVVFRASGVIHEFDPTQKITRTFEMENTPFGVQLEILKFEQRTSSSSYLSMQVVYESTATRDQLLQMHFAQGINGAHTRLQNLMSNLK
ncbi:SRPBCC domain-containing protein [Hymenobacter sp.]|uniref:SRPBCC family protein n=1 Tax=Hymenobacter sp. TaxID=1898978 RepID=UPI00286BE898|nr:SRPBCC domain-containing protein [Hymenobacter sp.]